MIICDFESKSSPSFFQKGVPCGNLTVRNGRLQLNNKINHPELCYCPWLYGKLPEGTWGFDMYQTLQNMHQHLQSPIPTPSHGRDTPMSKNIFGDGFISGH